MNRPIILLLLLLLPACACKQVAQKSEASTPVTQEPEEPASLRRAFPKNKPEQSAQLAQILKQSALRPTRQNGNRIYRAYNVSCRSSTGAFRCTLNESTAPGSRVLKLPTKASEALAHILFDLPIAQGDSGVETPFLECFDSIQFPGAATCNVAIELDYSGPY